MKVRESDRDLIARAAGGSHRAYGELYERYLDEIYRYIFCRVPDVVTAEDLTEEVFIRAWQKLPETQQKNAIQNFRAWIYRIAHNRVVDHLRSEKNRTHTPLEDSANLIQDTETPEEWLQDQQRSDYLAQVICSLDDTLQQVILLRFVNQCSHAETAQILGLQENHIRVLQYRALKKLRSRLEQDLNDG
jgi:RNA polymerase sigma-70 factor (ECF subfamily)